MDFHAHFSVRPTSVRNQWSTRAIDVVFDVVTLFVNLPREVGNECGVERQKQESRFVYESTLSVERQIHERRYVPRRSVAQTESGSVRRGSRVGSGPSTESTELSVPALRSYGKSKFGTYCSGRGECQGVITTLIQPSSFSLNVSYICGALSSDVLCVMTNEGSISSSSIFCKSGLRYR